jgi:DNA-binding CsgD family transcriptional regulator
MEKRRRIKRLRKSAIWFTPKEEALFYALRENKDGMSLVELGTALGLNPSAVRTYLSSVARKMETLEPTLRIYNVGPHCKSRYVIYHDAVVNAAGSAV